MASLKSLGLPESFCFAPYTNLDLDQDGTFYPCYRSKEPQGQWKDYDVTETINSEGMQNLRMDLWNGRQNANCTQCHSREAKGIESTREQYNKHFLELAEDLDFVKHIKNKPQFSGPENIHTLEIRPHNLCNLACGHCDEHSSSRWLKMKAEVNKDDFAYHTNDDPSTLRKLYSKASNLKTVHFTGGEPLIYASSHKEWLHGIHNKSDVELRYHTNLQHDRISTYKHEWDLFKHVKFFISIDVSERYYPYFRFGGKWNRMDYNIKMLKDYERVGVITVNFFTMLDFVPLVKYITDNNMQLHVAFVDPPHPLSITNMSREQKQHALESIQQARPECKFDEEWKTLRALGALRKIEEFIKTGHDGDDMHESLQKHLEYLDNKYKMRWNEL